MSPPKVIYTNDKGAISNRRMFVEPWVPIRWDKERRRGRYFEDSHRSIFTDKVFILPPEKFLGITKMPKQDQVRHIYWMKSQAKLQAGVFFYNNPFLLIRKVSSVHFQGLWFSTFTVIQKSTRVYTFTEADFYNVHIDDIETLYTDLKTLTKRPLATAKGLDAVRRFIMRNQRNSEIFDFQIGLESHQNTINLTLTNQDLPNIDRYSPFEVLEKPALGVVYLNEKDEKKFMRCDEVHKYSDGTLHFINKGLATEKKRLELEVQKTGYWINPSILIDKVFRITEHRLEHRNVLRRLECFYGLRKIDGPARMREEIPPQPWRDEGPSRKTKDLRRKSQNCSMDPLFLVTTMGFKLMIILPLFVSSILMSQITITTSKLHVVKTIRVKEGDIIDCVDIYKQPAFNHPALKNHTIQKETEKPEKDRNVDDDKTGYEQYPCFKAVVIPRTDDHYFGGESTTTRTGDHNGDSGDDNGD
ncbi:hypothetical protein OSB04_030990 [Centaurea solstitialis]|uniref:Neprosin activation peptide domain-containing protein n=1 Tax=Centaurea solstitialis TaxID=347529 RepID=A0AA38SS65_9ASTR|nr:hypothetical protein OSB04_030990 [Centaurea solstitialis]